MKLIHQSYVKNGAGEVKVVPEEGRLALLASIRTLNSTSQLTLPSCACVAEDMWHVFAAFPQCAANCSHVHSQLRTCGTHHIISHLLQLSSHTALATELWFHACAAEDMWHVFNLVREGDRVTGTTFRKVAKDSGTGAESERVKLRLTIQVEGVEFDPEGERRLCFIKYI